jgi:hypothetical protein
VADEPTPPKDVQSGLTLVRTPDFQSLYANNVHIETSAWDATLVLGQFDGKDTVKQRASVTMAWAEAKAVCDILMTNIAFYEAFNGRIKMPKGLTPRQVPPEETDAPHLKILNERVNKIRELLFGHEE